MAIVLTSEDNSYFAPASLRRSHSQNHFDGQNPSYHSISKVPAYSHSAPSSAPSSPCTAHAESTDLSSYVSTPASNFSIVSDYDDTLAYDELPEEDFSFPSYSQAKFFHANSSPEEPPPSPKTGDSYSPSFSDQDDSIDTSRPGSPEFADHAEDDTAITSRPSRQVDYLSHDWREEDIWSSWRYIVNRRGEFTNSERLENASWRTWMKSKNNLKTISPESLNWLKDCDVTWLYGPLQLGPGPDPLSCSTCEPDGMSLSKSGSLVNLSKKPILKKRSMSEVMLQRSLSTASLLKQAAAAVQAQEKKGILRPHLGRAHTDYTAFPLSSSSVSQEHSRSMTASTASSGATSPSTERKHIHFNEQVEQCIAVDVKGEDDEDMDIDPLDPMNDGSDSDDGVMMKAMRSKRRGPRSKKRSKKTPQTDGKTIEKLPSTTLKYRADTPEPRETAMKHSTGQRSSLLSPSSSQETLRPARRSGRFCFGDDEDLEDGFYDPNTDWSSPPPEPTVAQKSGSLLDEPSGMRRTPSGMFMPYEEGDIINGEGIFGRVIDTVNTARDIAHVIWNVGWRK